MLLLLLLLDSLDEYATSDNHSIQPRGDSAL
jgi:hypothetical protein